MSKLLTQQYFCWDLVELFVQLPSVSGPWLITWSISVARISWVKFGPRLLCSGSINSSSPSLPLPLPRPLPLSPSPLPLPRLFLYLLLLFLYLGLFLYLLLLFLGLFLYLLLLFLLPSPLWAPPLILTLLLLLLQLLPFCWRQVNSPAAFYSTPECCVFKLAHVCFHTWWMWLSNSFISVVIGNPGLCNDKEVTSQSLSVSKVWKCV